MGLHIGDCLPDGILRESTGLDESTGCSLKPETIPVSESLKGKKLVIFGVPGAFTPTCSAQHLPGYIEHHEAFKAQGVDEIWCLSVNDAFVMAAWGRERGALGKVRMMADGGATYTRQLGLEQDLTDKGLGIRGQRFALIAEDGRITYLAVELPGQFEGSRAEAVLMALQV
ncbi:peroxiredoxin [Candidatus Woesearchaeota archaeon]|nr:peroxiredoxin [Candidatus Woesearchaeota archaeon]